jgi:hypothetical protein
MKVIFCCPTITEPYPQFLEACRAELPLFQAAGIECGIHYEVGCPYISHARATLLRKALDEQPDVVVFLDHDLSWKPGELLRLVQTEGPVIAGTYRFKKDDEHYMGMMASENGVPITREDGCMKAWWVPGGFLKITTWAIEEMMIAWPLLLYGSRYRPSFDLFNHGAHLGQWYGEDYAFSRRWIDQGGEIWIVPDLELTHHGADGKAYPGNFAAYLKRELGDAPGAEVVDLPKSAA